VYLSAKRFSITWENETQILHVHVLADRFSLLKQTLVSTRGVQAPRVNPFTLVPTHFQLRKKMKLKF